MLLEKRKHLVRLHAGRRLRIQHDDVHRMATYGFGERHPVPDLQNGMIVPEHNPEMREQRRGKERDYFHEFSGDVS
jgi:hypothetical protein